ncbi:MAG: glycosyltransferase family 4 protein [Anaerolineae bacterium]|nr:glycosyltransferase family 4 protein [Anaerolineae bacterium]
MTRIGIDTRLHAYAPGGISHYARRLVAELATMLEPGTLTVIPHRSEQKPTSIPGVRRHRAWTPPHNRLERWAMGAEIWPLRLDILHSTDFIPPAWGARRFIITVHDLNFLYYPQYLTGDARRYYNRQIAWAVAKADAILADSFATRRDLEELLQVPASRVTVTHLAADERFRPLAPEQTEAVLSHYGLEAGYLLFVGTWEPRKNLPGLLAALSQLHARGEKRHLVISGRPGWLYDEIFMRVHELQLEPWVHFLEQPSLNDLVALYNGALLLVMPSFYEGFGLPALEAMQCGIPVVAANRASLPEVVGQAGLLVDPEDPKSISAACERLAGDATLRAALREAGFAQAAAFTWKAAAQTTLEVYRSVL